VLQRLRTAGFACTIHRIKPYIPDRRGLILAELSINLYAIAALFMLVAMAYSSVGLGGGSSYVALLAIFGFSHAVIPMVSLTLNLLATTAAGYNFIRQRHASLRLVTPFLLFSMPMAYLGGSLQVPKEVFLWLLLLCLCFVAARIYLWKETAITARIGSSTRLVISALVGAALGLVAGVVGIGGGIFLVPLIIILGLGTPKQAAACGVIFIWLNSVAGLASRLQFHAVDWLDYTPLYIGVMLGGALGSYLGSSRLSSDTMEKVLGAIVIVAIVTLLRKLFML
jgi:uncharacterized membrane protein YfcA